MNNPKIIHRIYFNSYPPYHDPFSRFLETWKKEMPDYTIMYWNENTMKQFQPYNKWMQYCIAAKSPVFMSEYIRWKVLQMYGGLYLDADCEILNGKKLNSLVDQLYSSDDYSAFLGIEEYNNGNPTAQSVAAKKNSPLVTFMVNLYENALSSPLWYWREERFLIGPQLISLYFRDNGYTKNKGFFCHLEKPSVHCDVKIYTQDYFSPKFGLTGVEVCKTNNTCVYHLFSNLNVSFPDEERNRQRDNPLLFNEYSAFLRNNKELLVKEEMSNVRNKKGKISFIKVVYLIIAHPVMFTKKLCRKVRRICH